MNNDAENAPITIKQYDTIYTLIILTARRFENVSVIVKVIGFSFSGLCL